MATRSSYTVVLRETRDCPQSHLRIVSFFFSFTRSQFSIRLKTRSSHGMIFYVSDQEENDFMTLFLAHGRLVFMFNVGHKKLKIRSQEKYNDGLWHDVS